MAKAAQPASPPDIQRLQRFIGIVFAAFAETTAPKGEADPPTAGWSASAIVSALLLSLERWAAEPD